MGPRRHYPSDAAATSRTAEPPCLASATLTVTGDTAIPWCSCTAAAIARDAAGRKPAHLRQCRLLRGSGSNRAARRRGQPTDVAPVAVFLASDDARWVTGEILVVSGGL
jgi:NAD(P)-dependent dehydrogenase (short-subunit alcohol dehydrogenase family)